MLDIQFAIGFLVRIAIATIGTIATPTQIVSQAVSATPMLTALPGREKDARVAAVAFRVAIAGRVRCPVTEPVLGLVLQHLSQFEIIDRPGLVTDQSLDRGPSVAVVVPAGPASTAGLIPGDVLLAIDGRALPPEGALPARFDARIAHARADAIDDLLAANSVPFIVTRLRGSIVSAVRVIPLLACPSRVYLARSEQRNSYADGRHVFLTTGLLARIRNDHELAFVIAHEMAHNILRHATIMRGGMVRRGLKRTLGRSGQIVRETEREADALGGELMLDAGFDPIAGAHILRRLGKGILGITLFAAHDSVSSRISAMRMLAEARRTP